MSQISQIQESKLIFKFFIFQFPYLKTMSTIRPFESSVSNYTQQQYISYLQDQLEKLSSFMLFQKKENQKYNHLSRTIEGQNQKIKILGEKVLLMQLYQNENLKNSQKAFKSLEKTISLQKRVNMLQELNFSPKFKPSSMKPSSNSYDLDMGIKEKIMKEMDGTIKNMYEELSKQITQVQRNLTKKIIILCNDKDISQKEMFNSQQLRKRACSKENMTPAPTCYTQNERSRLKEFGKSEALSKKESNNRIDKRVSSWVDQRILKINNQFNSSLHQNNEGQFQHSLRQHSQINCAQQRSPISSYLKKQNEELNQIQREDSHNQINFKPFYSVIQSQSTSVLKKKHKKSRSKSRSQRKSNRSISKSNKSHSKDKITYNEIKIKKSSSKPSKNINIKGPNTERIIKKNQSKHKHVSNKMNKENKRDSKSRISLSIKEQKPLKIKSKIKQRNESKISQFQLSYVSSNSRSRSKSLPKQTKNQKEYLLCCEKFH